MREFEFVGLNGSIDDKKEIVSVNFFLSDLIDCLVFLRFAGMKMKIHISEESSSVDSYFFVQIIDMKETHRKIYWSC